MMPSAQSSRLASSSSTSPLQQQQQNCVVTTTRSTSEHTHHHPTSTCIVMSHRPSTVVMSSSQPDLALMTSRPQLLPVPVARNSFRIDDILGDECARRGELLSSSTRNKEACKLSTSTDHQALQTESTDREFTERPRTDDIGRLHHHHRCHYQQQQQQQHGSSRMDQRAGHVDAVELRRSSTSPVAERLSDSAPACSSRHHHITSGGQSSASPPPSPQDRLATPADLHVGADRHVSQRQSDSDQHGHRLSPPKVTSTLHSAYPTLQQCHQHQQHYGQVDDSAGSAVFVPHHPLLGGPSSPSPVSAASLDSLHAFFSGRHGTFLSGCEFMDIVPYKQYARLSK